MKRVLMMILTLCSLFVLTGCMTTRNGNKADNPFPDGDDFKKKSIAILPVNSQKSITTDSHTPLKKSLNSKIGTAIKEKLPSASLIQWKDSQDTLNDSDKLDLIEKLMNGYESTGAYDKKVLSSLCSTLKSDYILVSRLKVESIDIKIGKSFFSSLEVALVGKNSSEPVWSGIGDFKRFGMYGFGGTETNEAATELVNLALGEL